MSTASPLVIPNIENRESSGLKLHVAEASATELAQDARILAIGLGNAGCNVVDNLAVAHDEFTALKDIELLAVDTDRQKLDDLNLENRLCIGEKTTRGEGTGSNPELGMASAEEKFDELSQYIDEKQLVLIIAGMGGGTGTGASVRIAEMCKEKGIPCIALVHSPWTYDSPKTKENAESYMPRLLSSANMVVQMPNENVESMCASNLSVEDWYLFAGKRIRGMIAMLTDMLHFPGTQNIDFSHVRGLLSTPGHAMITVTELGSGDDWQAEAVSAAVTDQLFANLPVETASSALVYFVLNEDFAGGDWLNIQRALRAALPGVRDYRVGFRESDDSGARMLLITGGINAGGEMGEEIAQQSADEPAGDADSSAPAAPAQGPAPIEELWTSSNAEDNPTINSNNTIAAVAPAPDPKQDQHLKALGGKGDKNLRTSSRGKQSRIVPTATMKSEKK